MPHKTLSIMTTYISILRGINVSGKKLVKMDALSKMYESIGFKNIKTYVQSGNVVFASEENDLKKLEKIISSQIETEFGFNVPVIVFDTKTLETIIENNPFSKDSSKESVFMHVTFLAESPKEFDKEVITSKKQPDEEIAFAQNAVYLYCPNGYARTKLNNNYIESKLKVNATTRNWKTTNELLKLAVEIGNK